MRSWTAALSILIGSLPTFGATAQLAYPAPPSAALVERRDIAYAQLDAGQSQMDVYRPRMPGVGPALIFFNVAAGDARRSNEFYRDWGRLVASRGLVGIVPDLHTATAGVELDSLLSHLVRNARKYGIDSAAIALYVGSGNVFTALPLVERPGATRIRAAVIYYGTAPITNFRPDVPLLYVRAGLDRPTVNGAGESGIAGLVARAIQQNVPINVINHPFGHHAFDLRDSDAGTRAVIDATIDFVKRATSASYQTALREHVPDAVAAGMVVAGNFHDATAVYQRLVEIRPEDHPLHLSYGEALLGDGQFAKACAVFGRLRGKGLGARDLGLPAARACVQGGDPDAAVGWLNSIPAQFLPPSMREEPVFAPLRSRPDFIALFSRVP